MATMHVIKQKAIQKYRAFFPVCRKVLKMTFWNVPSAGGLMLQLSTAWAGPRKLH